MLTHNQLSHPKQTCEMMKWLYNRVYCFLLYVIFYPVYQNIILQALFAKPLTNPTTSLADGRREVSMLWLVDQIRDSSVCRRRKTGVFFITNSWDQLSNNLILLISNYITNYRNRCTQISWMYQCPGKMHHIKPDGTLVPSSMSMHNWRNSAIRTDCNFSWIYLRLIQWFVQYAIQLSPLVLVIIPRHDNAIQ